MIEWTIPKAGVLTGYTEETQTSSTSFAIRQERIATGGTELYTDSGRTAYSAKRYTSYALTWSTTFFSWSSSETYTFFTFIGGPGSYTDGFSGSSSSEEIQQTTSQQSAPAQTSTTETSEYTFAVSLTTATTGSGWSYASSSFFTVSANTTDNTTSAQTGTVTFDTTTESGTLVLSGLADTILQAAISEVIWYYSAITDWSGLSAATNSATSATRITISPTYVTALLPKVTQQTNGTATTVLGNVSTQWTQSLSSYLTNYTTTLPSQEIATVVVSTHLPNLTGTQTRFRPTTESASLEDTVFASFSSSIAAAAGKTQIGTLATSSYKSPGTLYSGSLEWDALRTEAVVHTFTKSAPIALCLAYQSSTETSQVDDNTANFYTSSQGGASGNSSGRSIDQNDYAPLPPSCSVSVGPVVGQSKFVPRAAKLGTSSGYWFELDVSDTISDVTYAPQARSPLTTVMPTTASVATYNSDSVTFTKSTQISGETGTTTTTSSGVIQIAGTSTTTTFATGPIGIWGGYPGEGETFANLAGATRGVYRDRIGGETIAIEPGATTFSTFAPLSFLEPIYGIVAPMGFDEQTRPAFGYWTEARNSTALPPTMPPNA